jgi:hypothetical protein
MPVCCLFVRCTYIIGLEFHIVAAARVLQTYNVNWTIQTYSNSNYCLTSRHFVPCEMSGDDSLPLHNHPGLACWCFHFHPSFLLDLYSCAKKLRLEKCVEKSCLFRVLKRKRGCIFIHIFTA